MRVKLIVFFIVCVALSGCSRESSPAPANSETVASQSATSAASPAVQPAAPAASSVLTAAKPKVDACALLTSDEIKAVQGEAVSEMKLTGQDSGGFNLSQCFYSLPTFTNSISLMVAHRGDGTDARDPKEFWRSTFHEDERDGNESRREKEKEEEGEVEGAPPERVAGLGNEAYWTGNQVSGALYILKGNSYVRISIGGPPNAASRKRSRALAQKVLARL